MSESPSNQANAMPLHCGFDPPLNGDKPWSRRAFVSELPLCERYDVQGWNSLFVYGGVGSILFVVMTTIVFGRIDFLNSGGSLGWVAIRLIGLISVLLLVVQGFVTKAIMRRRVARRPGRLFDPTSESCMLVEIEELTTHAKFKFNTEDMGLICARNGWLDLELSSHRARFPLHEVRVVPVGQIYGACVQLHYEAEFPSWRVAATVVALQRFDLRDLVPWIGSKNLEHWINTGRQHRCRKCGYDLKSIEVERCPECGVACYSSNDRPNREVASLPTSPDSRASETH